MAARIATPRSPRRCVFGALALLALGGCVDVEAEIALLDAASARVTSTATMSEDMFALLAAQTGGAAEMGALCADTPPVRIEGRVSCTTTLGAGFAGLPFSPLAITPVSAAALMGDGEGPARVRVEMSTEALREEVVRRVGGALDPQAVALTDALFAGHTLTLSVTGARVHATNMERSAEGARITVPLDALLAPHSPLPQTYYATMDLNPDASAGAAP